MLELRVLGPIELVDDDGTELRAVLAQPKRFALLAYLAVAHPRGYHRRDSLLALFWPELDTARARNALNQALRFLRRTIGADVIASRGAEELGIGEDRLRCDVTDFCHAMSEERWSDAVALYRGELLDGFFADGSPPFNEWAERERDRHRHEAALAASRLAETFDRSGDVTSAAHWARRSIELVPDDERAVRSLITLLERGGDRASALHAYAAFARRLGAEFDAQPSAVTRELAERMRERDATTTLTTRRTSDREEALSAIAAPSAPTQKRVVTGGTPAARRPGWRLAMLSVLALSVFSYAAWHPASHAATSRIHSLAVLSFRNITGDSSQEYVAEELTEGVRRELAMLPSIPLKSAASGRKFGNTNIGGREIARALDVDAFVTGTVSLVGDRIRVSTELIDGRADTRRWTRTYERPIDEILSLYPDVARGVSSELSVTLADEGSRPMMLKRLGTKSTAAADAFIRGEYYRKRWMAAGCFSAVPAFREAISLDSTFAAAYAGLASCYVHPDRLRLPAAEVLRVARWALARALALDANYAPAHYYLGFVEERLEYKWQEAGREFRRAVTLDSAYPDAQRTYGEYLIISGHEDEGLKMMRRSIELDPAHLDNRVSLAFSLRNVGRYDEAIGELRHTLALDPDYVGPTRLWIFETYALQGRYDDAVAEYLAWARHTFAKKSAGFVDSLSTAYARNGWDGFLRKELALAELEVRHPGAVWASFASQYTGAYHMARRYARLGRMDRAMAWLQRAYDQRQQLLVFMSIEPNFVRLRGNARFRALAARVTGD